MSLLVTKHCTPENRDRMLNGNFRIGTTLQYARTEGGGLFDDKKEGHADNRLVGNQVIKRMTIAGGHFENVSFEGSETAISQTFEVDNHIFCASNGDYSTDRHSALLIGNDDYPPNEKYTAYLVLDKLKLSAAILAAVEGSTGRRHDIAGASVTYADRHSEHADQQSFIRPEAYQNAAAKAIFYKPERFSIEDEYRYMAAPRTAPTVSLSVIDTENLSDHVKAAFKAAIIRSGDVGQESAPSIPTPLTTSSTLLSSS